MNKLKQGTVREDGKVFWRYDRGSDRWVTPKRFAALREKQNRRLREYRAAWTPKQREQWNQQQREYHAAWTPEKREQGKQRLREQRAARTPEQREQYKQQQREQRAVWTPENREKKKQYLREYQKQNPEIYRAIKHRRKARKLAQLHPELDRVKEEALHAQCIELTHSTGVLHHADHIIPLSCGGWHHHDNLQCLPANLNLQKKDNPVWEHHGYKCWRDVPTHLWPEQLDKLYSSLLV
jgi:hypothetical protein